MDELRWEQRPELDRPVLVVAFAGLFDAATAATGALEWLIEQSEAEPLARIDPEQFFDFQQTRPRVELTPEGGRRIVWPEHVAHLLRGEGEERDLIVLGGVEPNYRWRTFSEIVARIATETAAEMVVTLGASPAQVPHTRWPVVFGSSTNAELARRLGLSRPQYQGPTGVLGVLQAHFDRTGMPAIAMRVGVPHYAMTEHNPKAAMALLRHLEHVTGVPTRHALLAERVADWEARLDAAVNADVDARSYVARLEALADRQAEQQVPSGDELAAEVERFLREQRGGT